jgi:transcription initiation factor TFIIIB Brf1 subunit/transcription initiation factor TFIIB
MGKRSVKRVFGKKTVRRYIENMTIGIRSMMTILTVSRLVEILELPIEVSSL